MQLRFDFSPSQPLGSVPTKSVQKPGYSVYMPQYPGFSRQPFNPNTKTNLTNMVSFFQLFYFPLSFPAHYQYKFSLSGRTLQLLKPSPNSMISAISVESGTTMEIGLNMDLRLSGSSVRPA